MKPAPLCCADRADCRTKRSAPIKGKSAEKAARLLISKTTLPGLKSLLIPPSAPRPPPHLLLLLALSTLPPPSPLFISPCHRYPSSPPPLHPLASLLNMQLLVYSAGRRLMPPETPDERPVAEPVTALSSLICRPSRRTLCKLAPRCE